MSTGSRERWKNTHGRSALNGHTPHGPSGPGDIVRWVETQMDLAQKTGRFTVRMLCDAGDAAAILDHYRSNIRRENAKYVGLYRREMVGGRWGASDSRIVFSTARRLINGHHRLTALAGANELADREGIQRPQVEFDFAFGFPPESVAGMDVGCARTGSQVAAALGVQVDGKTLSALRWFLRICEGLSGSHRMFTTQELLDAKDGMREALDLVGRFIATKHPAPVWGAVLAAYDRDPRRVCEFAEGLCRKGRDDSGPVTTLLAFLDRQDAAGSQNQRRIAIHTLYALRAWTSGKDLTRFSIKNGGDVDGVIAFIGRAR